MIFFFFSKNAVHCDFLRTKSFALFFFSRKNVF